MNIVKRIILISLLLTLLIGAFFLNPLVRFGVNLRLERFEAAQTIYLTRLCDSNQLHREAAKHLRSYVEAQLDRYYQREIGYDRIMDTLSPLVQTRLPQTDIQRCLRSAIEMEKARADLAQADAHYASGDYAHAIPLFRQALIADGSAAFRLQQAEALYKNAILDEAEAAIDAGEYGTAKGRLQESVSILGSDADLAAALEDVQRLEAGETYNTQSQNARRLLQAEGPEAAFGYVADLLQQTPDAYELVYLDQLLRHEYEEDICTRALSLLTADDPAAACALLEEGLLQLDSERLAAMYAEARAKITFWLVDMPVTQDETADARTGMDSSIARDQVLMDSLSNEYQHSFWADNGSVSFALGGEYSVFAGTVAFPMWEKADLYRASATLRIFADGKLLAEFKNMDKASAPVPFSLPMDGVIELRLVWVSEGANGWKDWGRFATIFDGRFLIAAPEQ